MIGYAMVGTNDLARSAAFYDDLLALLGAVRLMEFPGRAILYGVDPGQPMLAVGHPFDGRAAAPGNGVMTALVMADRNGVDALHARALALGGTDEGAPGVRGENGPQAFYAAYFRDFDGNKLCAYRVGPA